MKPLLLIIGIALIAGCSSPYVKGLSFSGVETEVSAGKEIGTDQSLYTNKFLYGGLLRLKWDMDKPEKDKK